MPQQTQTQTQTQTKMRIETDDLRVYSKYIPEEIRELPHWTTHKNKRPQLPPNKWADAKTFDDVFTSTQTGDYGILVAPVEESPYLFIDIDFPGTKEEKAALTKTIKNKMANREMSLGDAHHIELIDRTIQSIADTELPELIPRTYTEFSPSLAGLRMIIRSEDKGKFKKAYKKSTTFTGQIDFKNQFITITGMRLPNSPSTVLEVPLLGLTRAFGFAPKGEGKEQEPLHQPSVEETEADYDAQADDTPTTKRLQEYLDMITLSPDPTNNKKVHEEWHNLTGQVYEHYQFWLSIGMALHDYGVKTKSLSSAFLMFLNWSKTDKAGFESEESVQAKWDSFSEQEHTGITWRTIIKLANKCVFSYPRPIIYKGKNTGLPEPNEWENFAYLLDFYNIKLYQGGGYFITGNPDIIEKYFMVRDVKHWFNGIYGPFTVQTLQTATLIMCQNSRWRKITGTHAHVNNWISRPVPTIDLVKEWLDTPFENLPKEWQENYLGENLADFNDTSTFADFVDIMNLSIRHDDDDPNVGLEQEQLYTTMIKKTLMQFLKFREHVKVPFQDNGGMLILIGAENTRKSTFCRMLLPEQLKHMHKEINAEIKGEKGFRDFHRALSSKAVIQIDEFEGLMDHKTYGSHFKNIISGNDSSMVDIYQTEETIRPRTAVIIATTNETRHVLSDNGSRRMWFVRVDIIDTRRLIRFNLHHMYNTLRKEFHYEMDQFRQGYTETLPWLMAFEEQRVLAQQNNLVSTRTDIGMSLEELWPTYGEACSKAEMLEGVTGVQGSPTKGKNFTDGFNGQLRVLTTSEVMQILELRGLENNIKRSALERALRKHCGSWTRSVGASINIEKPKCTLEDGALKQGRLGKGFKYNKWLLPPMNPEYVIEVEEEPQEK